MSFLGHKKALFRAKKYLLLKKLGNNELGILFLII